MCKYWYCQMSGFSLFFLSQSPKSTFRYRVVLIWTKDIPIAPLNCKLELVEEDLKKSVLRELTFNVTAGEPYEKLFLPFESDVIQVNNFTSVKVKNFVFGLGFQHRR